MRPIFIVGCERSGTTMLAARLGTAERAVCLPESQFVLENATDAYFSPDEAEDLSARIQAHFRYKAWREVGSQPPLFSSSEPQSYSSIISAFVRSYATAVDKSDADVFIEHSPNNLLHIDRLIGAFPDCRIVHIVRDGRAVAASILPLDFGPCDILHAASFWATRMAVGLAAERQYGPDRILTVKYEDLIAQPQYQEDAIFAFAGLRRVTGAQGAPEGFRRPGYARSTHDLVGQPADPSRLDAWKKSLGRRQLEMFEAEVGSLLSYLGYQPVTTFPRSANLVERVPIAMNGMARRVVNMIRYRLRHGRLLIDNRPKGSGRQAPAEALSAKRFG